MSLSGLQGFRRWNPINIQKKDPAGTHFLNRKCSTPHAGSPANKLAGNQQKNRQRWYVSPFILTELLYALCPTSRKGGLWNPNSDSSIISPEHAMRLEVSSAVVPPEQHWRHTQTAPSSLDAESTCRPLKPFPTVHCLRAQTTYLALGGLRFPGVGTTWCLAFHPKNNLTRDQWIYQQT